MSALRGVQIDLEVSVEDRVNQLLGFREFDVQIPQFGTLNPRPRVDQVSPKRYSEASIAKFIDLMGTGGVPNALYEVRLSRQVPESAINVGGHWLLKRDDGDSWVECMLLQVVLKDSRWLITLGVLKTEVYDNLFC